MLTTHAVGIDLGTTNSCIAYLNEHGEPVSIANEEGEITTPSVVLFDEDGPIVGKEAFRNAIATPEFVVMNSKRHLGNPKKRWRIRGKIYTPTDIAALVLKKLLRDAEKKIGKVQRAVITVPAQFSDAQRQATIKAGLAAGLKHVDIINEPVAASLCYVLGAEGLWFSELAHSQRILVYDLGGGTFDLSLVNYEKNQVSVLASTGNLKLGGIDFNRALAGHVRKQFIKELGLDVAEDRQSLQYLAMEVEQAKRSLSARERAALSCTHAGKRKTYQVTRAQFEKMTAGLMKRTQDITVKLLNKMNMGWAHVDVVLTAGGASRMPMVRDMLQGMSGWTLNTSLSPDQSIAHGATYYAGMLLSNSEFVHSIRNDVVVDRLAGFRQQSVSSRALGILVRDPVTGYRFPHYILPANTPLPASVSHVYGTVQPDQRRVHLHVIESGEDDGQDFVHVGGCKVDDLPENLPVNSEIEVTIHYDAAAKVHVSAREIKSGKQATAEIDRTETPATETTTTEAPTPQKTPTPARTVPPQSPPRNPTPVTSRDIGSATGEDEFYRFFEDAGD